MKTFIIYSSTVYFIWSKKKKNVQEFHNALINCFLLFLFNLYFLSLALVCMCAYIYFTAG